MAVAAPKAEKAEIFAWEGSDKRGKRIKGESRAASMALVRADLRRQGINPIKVTKKSALFRARKKKIRPGDIAVFSRQLATMMSSGVPLV